VVRISVNGSTDSNGFRADRVGGRVNVYAVRAARHGARMRAGLAPAGSRDVYESAVVICLDGPRRRRTGTLQAL